MKAVLKIRNFDWQNVELEFETLIIDEKKNEAVIILLNSVEAESYILLILP